MDAKEAYREPTPMARSENTADSEAQPPENPQLHLWQSTGHGAKVGFKTASYVAGPISIVLIVVSLVPTLFALGAGCGLAMHSNLPAGFGFYLFFAALGAVLGGGIGFLAFLVQRVTPSSRRVSMTDRARRPIRLFRRKEAAKSIASIPGRSRLWFWLCLTAIPAHLVLLAAFGTGVYVRRDVDRRLAAAISEADRDDPHWRLDDLLANREPVPVDENAALVVNEVVSLMPENWSAPPASASGAASRALADLAEAYQRLDTAPANVRLDDKTVSVLRTELENREDAVILARTVADFKRGWHELKPALNPLDIGLPETQAARTVARLLICDAAIRGEAGDADGSLDTCCAILGVCRSIGDEPMVASKLVRSAIGNVAMRPTRRALGEGEPTEEALARLQDAVLEELAQPFWLQALKGERAMLTALIYGVRTGELPIDALSSDSPSIKSYARSKIAPWGRLLFDNQLALGLEWTNELVAIARGPVAEQNSRLKLWEPKVLQVRESWHGSWSSTLPLLMLPGITVAYEALTRYQCDLGATAILLAAERHRRKTGDWPKSIAAIDPDILPTAPIDRFSNQPFRLERRDGQFLVYSIGPNLKDEHGTYEPKRWQQHINDDTGTGAWDVALRRQPASRASAR